jgi:MYXO-CTERM domain-containing protein
VKLHPATGHRPAPHRRGAVLAGSAVLAAGLMVLSAAPAWAHSQLIAMVPADGSTVAVAPTQVVLTFNENIQDIGDAVVVTGPGGGRYDDGRPRILDATATEQLRPLAYRGHYSVSYRIVSADGHPVTRTLGFTLSVGAAAATAAPAPTASPTSSTSSTKAGSSTGNAPLALALLVLAGVAAFLAIRLRRRPG